MKQREEGFTIVELLVSIALLGITAAVISATFISIRNIQSRTLYADLATRAAQREVETLRSANYGSLTAGQTIDFTSSLPTQLPKTKNGSVVVSQPATDIRRVDVTVNYTTGGKQRSVVLSSLIGALGLTR